MSPFGECFAYIDGGTGSMMWQAALAGFLTLGYVVRQQIGRVRHGLAMKKLTKAAPPR